MNTKFHMGKLYNCVTAFSFDLVLAVGIIALIISLATTPSNKTSTFADGWMDSSGNAVDLTKLAGTSEIYNYITPSSNNNAIIFRARNCYVDIYIDDILVSEDTLVTSNIIGKSPGSRWHTLSLPPSDTPLKITLKVTACFDNSKGTIDNFYTGQINDVYSKAARNYLVGFITCVFLQILSIVVMVIYIYLKHLFHVNTDFLYLGITAFFTSQWAVCESLVAQLFLGHSEFFHIMGYLSLVAIPLSFGLFGASRLKDRNTTLAHYAKAYSIVAALNILITTFLHVTGIYEFHYTLISVHILLVILIPVLIMLILSYRNEKTTVHYVIIPLLIFNGCILMSIYKYITGQYSSYSGYIRVALVSFLFCLIVYQSNEIAVTFSKGLKADMLHDLALNDHMTGLFNRTALNEHMDEYNHIIASYSPLGIVQFDVNNLKRVNDTQGHEVGDRMISAAATGLKQAFTHGCRAYRTGGDEFLVIIKDLDPNAIYEKGIAALKKYCEQFNSQPDLEFRLVIAHGFVTIKGNTTLSEAIDMADVLMYQDKRELKAKEKEA